MSYATRQDLVDRYGEDEIAQRESALAVGAVDRVLVDADAVIDSYVATRYSTPLSPVPVNIQRIACVLARYYLLGDAVSDAARDAYKDSIIWLRDVRDGKVPLDIATVATVAPSAALSMVSNGRDKAFLGGLR